MANVLTVFRREFQAYFDSSIAYIFLIVFLLASTGLSPFRDRPAGKLSGGMKQKLGLCCALIHDPDLLILDEPTTGLDPVVRDAFLDLVLEGDPMPAQIHTLHLGALTCHIIGDGESPRFVAAGVRECPGCIAK